MNEQKSTEQYRKERQESIINLVDDVYVQARLTLKGLEQMVEQGLNEEFEKDIKSYYKWLSTHKENLYYLINMKEDEE